MLSVFGGRMLTRLLADLGRFLQKQVKEFKLPKAPVDTRTKLSLQFGFKTVFSFILFTLLFVQINNFVNNNDPELLASTFTEILITSVGLMILFSVGLLNETPNIYFDNNSFALRKDIVQKLLQEEKSYQFSGIYSYKITLGILKLTMRSGEKLRINLNFYDTKKLAEFKKRIQENAK
jgi:hypothetical protein